MGDLSGHTRSLVAELRKIKYTAPVSWEMLLIGETTVFLPMLHHALLLYSQNIASEIMQKGYRLFSCTDQRFVESVFKLVRREFQQKPVLTVEQFLRKGFAEHKIIFLLNIIKYCRAWESKLKHKNQKPTRLSRSAFRDGSDGNRLNSKEALRLKILEKSRLKKEKKKESVPNDNSNTTSSNYENNNNAKVDIVGDGSNKNKTVVLDTSNNLRTSDNLEYQMNQLKNIFVMNINQINENITKFANSINTRLLQLENRVDKLEATQ